MGVPVQLVPDPHDALPEHKCAAAASSIPLPWGPPSVAVISALTGESVITQAGTVLVALVYLPADSAPCFPDAQIPLLPQGPAV